MKGVLTIILAHEVVHFAARDYPKGEEVTCTYITISQASRSYEVILSKPFWMWGAEMGVNVRFYIFLFITIRFRGKKRGGGERGGNLTRLSA